MHANLRAGVEVARRENTFERVDGGTLYGNCLIAGMQLPFVRRPFNALVRPRLFSDDIGRAWLRHDVEEVGNLQLFLPDSYERCRGACGER